MNDTQNRRAGGERTLRGWSEIAAYCDRTKSTVKRWAAERDLPVYRLAATEAGKGIPVYAYPGELDTWLKSGKAGASGADDDPPFAEPDDAPARLEVGKRLLLAGLACIAVVVAGLGMFAFWAPDAATHDDRGVAQAAVIPEEARELYLRGSYLWNRRTPEGVSGAIDALQRALDIHPDYAEAHAGLAMTYNLARQYSGMSGWEAYPKAEEHARRAVELDPRLDLAQSALAFVEFHWLWDVEAGLARFEEALRLKPDSSSTLMWYASALLHVERADDALPIISRAHELDPDSSAIYNMKALALFYSGRTEAAAELLRDIMERDPQYAWSYPSMYYLQISQGDYEGYLANYQKLGDLIGLPRYREAAEAGRPALAEGGVDAMARAMIGVEMQYYERGEALAWDIARHHAMIGNAEEAVSWLRISLERKEERLIGLLVDTVFRPIRDAPEFRALVAEIGLPADS